MVVWKELQRNSNGSGEEGKVVMVEKIYLVLVTDNGNDICYYEVEARDSFYAKHKARIAFEHDLKYKPKLRKTVSSNWKCSECVEI